MGGPSKDEMLAAAWPGIRTVLQRILSGTKVSRAAWYDTFHDIYVYRDEKEDSLLYVLTRNFLFSYVDKLYYEIKKVDANKIVADYIRFWSQYLTGCRQLISLYYCYHTLDVNVDKLEIIKKLCMKAWKVNMLDKMGNDLIECVVQDRAEHKRLTEAQVEEVVNSLVKVYYVLQELKETEADYAYLFAGISHEPYVGDIEAL